MRLELPEIPHEAQTLVAVGLGAVLATVGGFFATLLEARLYRRERRRPLRCCSARSSPAFAC